MTRTALFSLLSASALLGSSVAPDKAPDAAALQKMTARFAPVDIGADISGAAAGRAAGAGAPDRSGADHGRALPAPGLGRQRGAADGPRRRRERARPGAAAQLPDQQGPLVAPRPRRRVRPGRARQTRRRQLLSRRRDEGRPREVARLALGRRPRRRDSASSPRSAAVPAVGSSACPTASSTRAS